MGGRGGRVGVGTGLDKVDMGREKEKNEKRRLCHEKINKAAFIYTHTHT